ncbi:sodium/glutamate symporter [Prevotella sp. CAG:5226]|mgnify:FL=1|jgi:ESS family glutamate:Na+ symporter|uniref:sodium/glutamate symporter n=1 Tax=Prevotellamassilia timonensis TaxID=1852370 RepID=UPI000339099E|nr:sodium/glutamate symporter [Prevotellamassilia timonensis]CDA43137.1 sodium/glutamate symporter [Prevotella sp. CAG:5226]
MKSVLELDMLQTAGLGALALVLGMCLTRRVKWLQRFCIPSPVSGGIVFSVVSLMLYKLWNVELVFDGTLKDVFMLVFFTSVGFQSNLKVLRRGGSTLLLMLGVLAFIIVVQNVLPLGIAWIMGVNPLVGMAAGSISMAGGHGTAGGFSAVLEGMGLSGAGTIAMAAATFGLIMGSVTGGPLAERLIRTKLTAEHLEPKDYEVDPAMAGLESDEASPAGRAKHISSNEQEFQQYAKATYALLIVVAAGSLMSWLLQQTGVTFPTYFGALIVAAIVRNVAEACKLTPKMELDKIVSVGNICLSVFLGMAMVSLKLWELESLALPLVVMLVAQVVAMALIAYFVAFNILGRDYDAAVLVAGICGFGLGATPNAMANMSAVCYKYHYTVKPFLIVPIIGAMFVDLINTGFITMFLNWIGA